MGYVLLLLWLCVAVWASRVCGQIWVQFMGRAYRIIVAPGVIVHELSHAVACLLTGAKIREIHMFEKTGGSVVHEKPKIPVIGQPLISMAPIIGCGAALWVLAALLAPAGGPAALKPLPIGLVATPDGAGSFVAQSLESVQSFWATIKGADYTIFWTYLFIYLSFSISTSWGPSNQDLRNSALGLIVCVALLAGARFALARFDKAAWFDGRVLGPLSRFVTFAADLLLLLLALSAGVWLLVRALKLIGSLGKGSGG